VITVGEKTWLESKLKDLTKVYDFSDNWVESHSISTILLLCPKCFNKEREDTYRERCPTAKQNWEMRE
jgi:hypothetical protein